MAPAKSAKSAASVDPPAEEASVTGRARRGAPTKKVSAAPVEPVENKSARPIRKNTRKAYEEAPTDAVVEEDEETGTVKLSRIGNRRGKAAPVAAESSKKVAVEKASRAKSSVAKPIKRAQIKKVTLEGKDAEEAATTSGRVKPGAPAATTRASTPAKPATAGRAPSRLKKPQAEPLAEEGSDLEPPTQSATKSRARVAPAKKADSAPKAATSSEPPKRGARLRNRLLSDENDKSGDQPLGPVAKVSEGASSSTGRRGRKPKIAVDKEPVETDLAPAEEVATKPAPRRGRPPARTQTKDSEVVVGTESVKAKKPAPRTTRKVSKTTALTVPSSESVEEVAGPSSNSGPDANSLGQPKKSRQVAAKAEPAKKTTTSSELPKRGARTRKRILSDESDKAEEQLPESAAEEAPAVKKLTARKKKRLNSEEKQPLESVAEQTSEGACTSTGSRRGRKPKVADEPVKEAPVKTDSAPVEKVAAKPAPRRGRGAARKDSETIVTENVTAKKAPAPKATRRTPKSTAPPVQPSESIEGTTGPSSIACPDATDSSSQPKQSIADAANASTSEEKSTTETAEAKKPETVTEKKEEASVEKIASEPQTSTETTTDASVSTSKETDELAVEEKGDKSTEEEEKVVIPMKVDSLPAEEVAESEQMAPPVAVEPEEQDQTPPVEPKANDEVATSVQDEPMEVDDGTQASTDQVSSYVQSEPTTEAKVNGDETESDAVAVEFVKQNGTASEAIPDEPVKKAESPVELDTNNNDESNGHPVLKRKIDDDQQEAEIQLKRPRGDLVTGDLFTFGEQLVGEVGPREKVYKDAKLKRNEPSRVKLTRKAKQVACGAYHTLVITDEGQLVSFGCNDDGPLGRLTAKPEGEEKGGSDVDSNDEDYEEKLCAKVLPVKGEIKAKLVKVTAGDMHSAALDEDGNVFIWGNLKDDSNKIGLFADDEKNYSDYLPTRVPRQVDMSGQKVVDIASGNHHFLVLTEDGKVYSLGEGSKGQLGRIAAPQLNSIATNRELFIKPASVSFAAPVTISRVFAGQWSSFALTDTGVLYAWGLNNYFQLGFRTTKPVELADADITHSLQAELTPVQVPTVESMSKVVAVSCGQQHLAVLDIDGHIFTAGSVHYGKLGHGRAILEQVGEGAALDTLQQISPEKFGNDRVVYIECGDFSAFAITETGRLYAWGQGSLHIGTDENDDLFEPTLITGTYADDVHFQTGSSGSQFGGWIGSLKST